jgi:hypothetical protein
VAVVKTNVSEERVASIFRVTIGALGTTLAITGNGSTQVTANVWEGAGRVRWHASSAATLARRLSFVVVLPEHELR